MSQHLPKPAPGPGKTSMPPPDPAAGAGPGSGGSQGARPRDSRTLMRVMNRHHIIIDMNTL